MKRLICIAIMLCGLLATRAGAGEVLPDTAAIVNRANHVALYQGQAMKARVSIEITDRQGRTRKRELNIMRLDCGREKDAGQKYLAYFRSPADVRKMVFMVHKHADPASDDDRWLYLPALDLVKRIAAGDKRTSFVGSDFLYEDISGRSIFEDIHTLKETTDRYFIIENRPKHPETVKFERYLAYVDRNTFVTKRLAFYKGDDRLYRTMEVQKVEHIRAMAGGKPQIYPTAVLSVAKDLETGSTSRMRLTNIVYNSDISEKVFSERYLRRPPREITR